MDKALIPRRALAGIAGLLAGVTAGTVVAGAAITHRAATGGLEPQIEATHLPPLLTTPGEQVELRYDMYCLGGDDDPEGAPACDADGTAFVRAGNSGPFREVPLSVDADASEGRYVARVPEEIAGSPAGFSYYAVLRSATSGAFMTLPAGGAGAPQRSLPLERSVDVRLGAHRFGATRGADSRVAEATWGNGPNEVGLEQGRNLTPIGGSTFDVDRGGTVTVLDEANRRLLRWWPGARAPARVPLGSDGALADMALAADGTVYVLEYASAPGASPLVRIFGADGRAKGTVEVAERTASQIRMGPRGPFVLQHPSGQWMPIADDGSPLAVQTQRQRGRAGRPLPGGGEVVVLRRGSEIRAALVGAGGIRRSWRISSETPLAEVQLAEPLGNRLLLVARLYTDDEDEFLVLVLDQSGIAWRFAVQSGDWAETAPLSRFRLAGSSLYQLGSTPAGLFVDRFDLEVK
ncbi:MAG TPA: hypothetical protein VIG93_00820 [Gaiellaceae bacterium]